MAIKALSIEADGFDHHPYGLKLFRYLFIIKEFDEGVMIFSNNLILISGFYFLFMTENYFCLKSF